MFARIKNWLKSLLRREKKEELEVLLRYSYDELFIHARACFNDSFWRVLRYSEGECVLEHITGMYVTVSQMSSKLTSFVTVEAKGTSSKLLLRNDNPWLAELRKEVMLPLIKEANKIGRTLKKKGINTRAGGQ